MSLVSCEIAHVMWRGGLTVSPAQLVSVIIHKIIPHSLDCAYTKKLGFLLLLSRLVPGFSAMLVLKMLVRAKN